MADTKGADAVDSVIAQGLDLDGSPIPANKLELYKKVMGFEAGRQRSGVTNTMRSGGAWHCVIADREDWSETSSSRRTQSNVDRCGVSTS